MYTELETWLLSESCHPKVLIDFTPGTLTIPELIAAATYDFPEAFLNGGCYAVHELVSLHYPKARAWYNGVVGHVITEHEGQYYDVQGTQEPQQGYWLDIEPRVQSELKLNGRMVIAAILHARRYGDLLDTTNPLKYFRKVYDND